jgi:hypothetical protein
MMIERKKSPFPTTKSRKVRRLQVIGLHEFFHFLETQMAAPALAVGRHLHYRLWPALAAVCPEEFRERHQNEVRKAEFRGKLKSNPPLPSAPIHT